MHARAPTHLAGQFGTPAIPAAPPLLRAIRIALFSAVLAIAGVVLSVGWLLHFDALRRWGPDWPAMVPSSATCLLALSSGHLAFLVHPGQRTADLLKAACLVSAALAGGNAAIMIGGAETGLDRVLWPGALAQPRDGMSPATTICALLATAASFIISLQRPDDRTPAHASRLVEVLGICGLLMAGTAVVTYMLDAPALRHVDMFVAMSAQSALALVMLFVAILAAPSDGVVAGVLLGSLCGSSGARRLLPVMVFVPLAIAFAGTFATQREWIDARLGLSLMTMLMIAIGTAAVLVNAALQNRAERVQMQTLQTVTEAAEEKDLLLREVYHRVKNNLQRIDAMLAFESAQVADRGTRDAFEAMSHRIRALGIVHELLLRSERLANIDVADYMQRLTEELTRSNGLDRRGIAIVCDARPEIVDFETANTLGLLVNELVVNAIEHAFPFDTSGTIRVVFHRASQDTCRLTVVDDGVNNSVYDPTNPTCGGIGSRIIRSLARQLGGDLRVDTSLGTRVDVSFPCAAVEWSYSV